MSVGVACALKFKGYHPAGGLFAFILVVGMLLRKTSYVWVVLGLAVLVGAIVLAVMKDKNAERMKEMRSKLRAKGVSSYR